MLNIRYVATFLAVVRHASLRAAAAELGLSPATVSHHIKQLEQQTQAQLLMRGARAHATMAGNRLLPHAKALLRLNERALAAAQQAPLRLGAASNIGIYLLPPILQQLHGHQPGDPLAGLLIDTNAVIRERLAEGSLDMALVENVPSDDFTTEHWRDEPLVVIVSPNHPWRHRATITTEELARSRLLAGEPGTGTGALLREFLSRCDTQPAISAQLGSTEAVKRAVAHDHGISLVLAGTVEAEVSAGWLVAVPLQSPGLWKPLWAIWQGRCRPEGSHALLATLRSQLGAGQQAHTASCSP